MLREGGHAAYAVGGCIRNELLGFPVADVDFSTDATPARVSELAVRAGLQAVPTGVEHGTVTVVANNVGHEVTTFRKDVETDGRRAVIEYASSVDEDAHRRDFTINALYAEHDGTLVDPLGALPDVRARRIRFIDDPRERIREDYLRILRFFRFHAWFGHPEEGVDAESLAACAELAEGVGTLSKERIGKEMCRLLEAPDPAPSVASMEHSGVLLRILPGASSFSLAVLVHLETQAGVPPDWERRLACIGGEYPKEALRLSKSGSRRVTLLADNLGSLTGIDELAYRFGPATAMDVALLRAAQTGQDFPSDVQHRLAKAASAVFPVHASDLMPALSGPSLGKRLKELEDRWIASGFTLSRTQLLS